MSKKQRKGTHAAGGAGPRRPNPRHQDNYPHDLKAGAAQVCVECGLVSRAGRWQVEARPEGVATGLCPACTRIRERDPAGTLRLDAAFLTHRDEIERMARNEERAEAAEHPLERLMGLELEAGGFVITTTGLHLARRIAHALERRFHRVARYRYGDGDRTVLVDWAS